MKTMQRLLLALAVLLTSTIALAAGGGHWTSWARRPWIPRDLPGTQAWYRSDRSVTGLSNGAAVATVADLSLAGHDATQATGSKQPTYQTAQLNGFAAFRHDATGTQFLQTASFTFNAPSTLYLVYKQNAYSGAGAKDIIWDGKGAGSCFVIASSTVNQKWRLNAAINYDTAVANGAYDYVTVVYDTTGVGRVHGSQVVSGNLNAGPGGVTIGALADGTRGAQIDWVELIWVNHVSNATETTIVEKYFAQRYGL